MYLESGVIGAFSNSKVGFHMGLGEMLGFLGEEGQASQYPVILEYKVSAAFSTLSACEAHGFPSEYYFLGGIRVASFAMSIAQFNDLLREPDDCLARINHQDPINMFIQFFLKPLTVVV